MPTLRHHNPMLRRRLSILIAGDDAKALAVALGGLSNADARTAGYLLGEELLPAMTDGARFMRLFLATVPGHSKAFLGTFLKGAVALTRRHILTLTEREWADYAPRTSNIDRSKLLNALLPAATEAEAVRYLVELFGSERPAEVALHLVKAATPPCYYRLMCLMRTIEDDTALLRSIAIRLLRMERPIAYRMAALMSRYFDLNDLPATLSIQLPAYGLSRVDTTPEAFYHTLGKV